MKIIPPRRAAGRVKIQPRAIDDIAIFRSHRHNIARLQKTAMFSDLNFMALRQGGGSPET